MNREPRLLGLLAVLVSAAITMSGSEAGQPKQFPLESADGLRLNSVTAESAVLQGKKGLRVAVTEERARQFDAMTPEQRSVAVRVGQYAVVEGVEFDNGTIEAEIAGGPAPGASGDIRGFFGIAFRLANGAYDAIFLRATNGRADDQDRRNHTVQYISHPDWPWFRLRQETPSKYEAYVDLVPDVWTAIRIDVSGERARLFVRGQEQPTLIVNDLKTGAHGNGGVALWIGPSTVAYYRNLRLQPSSMTGVDPPILVARHTR